MPILKHKVLMYFLAFNYKHEKENSDFNIEELIENNSENRLKASKFIQVSGDLYLSRKISRILLLLQPFL